MVGNSLIKTKHTSGSSIRSFATVFIEAATVFLERLGLDHAHQVRTRALPKIEKWRTADVKRLLELPGLPPLERRRLERLLLDKKRVRGRPVLQPPPKVLSKAVVDGLTLCKKLWDPATSAKERRELYKKMPWYTRLIESAYRGELEKAQRRLGRRAEVEPPASGRFQWPSCRGAIVA